MSPKQNKTAILWQDQADLGLRGVLTAALGREPSHDISFNRNAIQRTGRGAGSVALYTVSSKDSTSGAVYGGVRRGLIQVASQVAALQEEEAFFVTAENFVATLVGLHVECDMVAADGGDTRKGLTRNPNEAHQAKLAADGVLPVMRKRNAQGNKAMTGCSPIDPSEPRWAKAIALMDDLNSQYGGFLGQDEDGVPRTAPQVVADVVKRQREMRKRNDEATKTAKADKAAKLVKMPAMKATERNLAAFLKAATAQGVDVKDPKALGEFACGAIVLAYPEKAKAKKTA